MRWYSRIGRRVWLYEIWCFLMRDKRTRNGLTLAQLFGPPQDREENALTVTRQASAAQLEAAE